MVCLGNRKGWEQGVVVTFLVIIASAVAMFGIYYYFWGDINQIEKDLACEKAIQLAATTKNLPSIDAVPGSGRPYFSIGKACPRNKLVLKYDDIVEDGSINQDKAHKILADAMYRCWKKVGIGKIDPFSNWGNDGESYCLLCNEISYDQKLENFINKNSDKISSENIDKYLVSSPLYYLATHTIPSNDGKQISYWEFLYNEKPKFTEREANFVTNSMPKSPILPGSTIVLTMYKPKSKSTGWKVVGFATSGVLVVGGLALIPFTGGASGLLLKAGLVLGGAVSAGLGAALAYNTFAKSFESCKECNGVGGVYTVPLETAFSEKLKISSGTENFEARICTKLVN